MNRYTNEQVYEARRTELYSFLLCAHPDSFKREGDSLRPKDNHSISIKRGYCGYMDFANGETGNSVDYLIRHMGYSFKEAVKALIGDNLFLSSTQTSLVNKSDDICPVFPSPEVGSYKHIYAYLKARGISSGTIQELIRSKILYQYKDDINGKVFHNMLFINPERDFAEKHGTISYGTSFHGVAKGSRSDGFWWFRTSDKASTAYVCEAAIDAISLYELLKEPAYYISIAGSTGKQPAIDRLKQQEFLDDIILAVDSDDAGQKTRDNNPDLKSIIPGRKDWNEDLVSNRKLYKNDTRI